MAISKTSICNKALHFIGIGEEIASINERSPEAEACLLFYDDELEELLREWPWPFARRQVNPGLVNDDETVAYNPEFFFAYRYPPEAVFIRKIVSGTVPDTEASLIRYQIGGDDEGKLILTNEANITIEYTKRVTDASQFPSDFATALSARIGSKIAPRLSEDPMKAGQVCAMLYKESLSKARAVAAQEESEGPPPTSSFQRAR